MGMDQELGPTGSGQGLLGRGVAYLTWCYCYYYANIMRCECRREERRGTRQASIVYCIPVVHSSPASSHRRLGGIRQYGRRRLRHGDSTSLMVEAAQWAVAFSPILSFSHPVFCHIITLCNPTQAQSRDTTILYNVTLHWDTGDRRQRYSQRERERESGSSSSNSIDD